MSRTKTIYIKLKRLQSGSNANTIIRLMMACNDITLANQCQGLFAESKLPQIRKHVAWGARMYFVRLQCGHICEAMGLIDEIRNDQNLKERIKKCSETAQEAFKKLSECLKNGTDYKKFKKYVALIRHKTAFHYDRKLIDKALSDRANRPEACLSKITMGDHISLSRFELADDIVDNIVCREIWKIPRGANISIEANLIADFGADLCRSLLEFGGEFISRYVADYSC